LFCPQNGTFPTPRASPVTLPPCSPGRTGQKPRRFSKKVVCCIRFGLYHANIKLSSAPTHDFVKKCCFFEVFKQLYQSFGTFSCNKNFILDRCYK
jgi:hypothetical protein